MTVFGALASFPIIKTMGGKWNFANTSRIFLKTSQRIPTSFYGGR
jgi:hypothetical protein